MREIIPYNLIKLADVCHDSLYIVGGSVRDRLCGFPAPERIDWDIASPCTEEELLAAAQTCGFLVTAVYSRTGTIKLKDPDGVDYEFTRFRSDEYVRGEHVPARIRFTQDIALDARRRDFCADAVYYDIRADKYVDPLGGMQDIAQHKLRTVAPAERVFGEDGLRLMRLARLAAQTGFSPDEECLAGARHNRALIRDIVPERIFHEMELLLHADEKPGGQNGPYRGLALLRATGVLAEIMPELAAGDGMAQRTDFHRYDVLEHSLRCVVYAPHAIRWAALLHDVGKPFCMLRDGNFHAHPEEGARIAHELLTRLKAPKQLTERVQQLVLLHMRDFDLKMRPVKVRREIIRCYPLLQDLFALRQADYSACKDDLSPAPAVQKWQGILREMAQEGVPLTRAQLAVSGLELQRAGVAPKDTARALDALLGYCAEDGARNRKEKLIAYAVKHFTEEC